MLYRKHPRSRQSQKSFRLESLESRLLLAADWQNPINPFDVNSSDEANAVSPLDALLVINELTHRSLSDASTGELPVLDGDSVSAYFDVNGDGFVSPFDALAVINELSHATVTSLSEQAFPAYSDRVMAGSRAALSHGIEHDTLVNSHTDRSQSFPDVAAGASGDVVVVWQSLGQDGSSWGIYAQRYDASGQKVGDEIQVNTSTKRSQRDASVAVADDGSFVVVWNSAGHDGASWGVYGQRFDSDGTQVGDEFLVNETTKGAQNHPDLTILSNGDLVVTWEGRGTGDNNGIFMRRFAADGSSVDEAGEVRVNVQKSGDQSHPSIGAIPGGDFVITWQGKGESDPYGIFMRRFNADGSDSGELRVNDAKEGSQQLPDVDVGPDGEFVIAWKQGDGRSFGVYAKQFAADGSSGDEFLVNQTVKGIQKAPAVAYLSDGRFSVSWFGRGTGDNTGTFTRTFHADGSAETDEELVNTTVHAAQIRPAAAAVNSGYVVTWQGKGIGDRSGVFARFYSTDAVGPFTLEPLGDRVVNEGETVSFTATVLDLDGTPDDVTFSLGAEAPSDAMIDSATGEFTWMTTEADDGEYSIDVIATEGDFSMTRSVDITVEKVNDAPVLGMIDDVTVEFDNPVSIILSATDPDTPHDSDTFSVTQEDGSSLPAWLSFDTDTRTLSGTPAESDISVVSLVATVTDEGGLSDSQDFTITVTDGSDPFTLNVDPTQTVDEQTQLTFTASITDDGEADNVALTAENLPTEASFDPNTGEFSWTPGESDGPGTATVTIRASSATFSTSQEVLITINEVNRDPVLDAVGNQTVTIDEAFSLTLSATDPDLPVNTLTYEVDLIEGSFLSFDATTGILSGTPVEGDLGTSQVTVRVTDGAGGVDSETFDINVVSGPFDVTVTGETTVDEATTVMLTASVVDTDGEADNATLSVSQLPPGATFDANTGVFSWTPGEADGPGRFTITVTATEGSVSVSRDVEITVLEVNRAPVLTVLSDETILVGNELSKGIIAVDPDFPANDLVYSVRQSDDSPLPSWLTFDGPTRLLSGTPTAADEGVIEIRVTVTDSGGLSDEEVFEIDVVFSSSPTLVSEIPNRQIAEGTTFNFDVTSYFNDADGDSLSFEANTIVADVLGALPAWLSFSSGVFSGTPPTGSLGTSNIVVTASDPDDNSVSDTFSLTVTERNNVTPDVVHEQTFRVAPTAGAGSVVGNVMAQDRDQDTLSYSIVSGNDAGRYAIDDASGDITVANSGALTDATVDALTVEVSDGTATSTATVTVYVSSSSQQVAYTLKAMDTDGNEITSVSPGQEFDLVLSVQDIRDEATGVFSAYSDVAYLAGMLTPGAITHSSTYGAGTSSSLATAGLVDELGGSDGINPLGDPVFEVARVRMTVSSDASGTLQFTANPTEDPIQHLTALFGGTGATDPAVVRFGTLTLPIDPA